MSIRKLGLALYKGVRGFLPQAGEGFGKWAQRRAVEDFSRGGAPLLFTLNGIGHLPANTTNGFSKYIGSANSSKLYINAFDNSISPQPLGNKEVTAVVDGLRRTVEPIIQRGRGYKFANIDNGVKQLDQTIKTALKNNSKPFDELEIMSHGSPGRIFIKSKDTNNLDNMSMPVDKLLKVLKENNVIKENGLLTLDGCETVANQNAINAIQKTKVNFNVVAAKNIQLWGNTSHRVNIKPDGTVNNILSDPLSDGINQAVVTVAKTLKLNPIKQSLQKQLSKEQIRNGIMSGVQINDDMKAFLKKSNFSDLEIKDMIEQQQKL